MPSRVQRKGSTFSYFISIPDSSPCYVFCVRPGISGNDQPPIIIERSCIQFAWRTKSRSCRIGRRHRFLSFIGIPNIWLFLQAITIDWPVFILWCLSVFCFLRHHPLHFINAIWLPIWWEYVTLPCIWILEPHLNPFITTPSVFLYAINRRTHLIFEHKISEH